MGESQCRHAKFRGRAPLSSQQRWSLPHLGVIRSPSRLISRRGNIGSPHGPPLPQPSFSTSRRFRPPRPVRPPPLLQPTSSPLPASRFPILILPGRPVSPSAPLLSPAGGYSKR